VCKQQRSEKYWSSINQQDFFRYDGPDYFEKVKEIEGLDILEWEIAEKRFIDLGPSHKSNFFKWELMAKESGVYADLDIAFVRPIDDWFEHVRNYDTAICYHMQKSYFSIGLLASSGQNNFYGDVYAECVKEFRQAEYQGAGVIILYKMLGRFGSGGHWIKMKKKYPDIKFRNFNMSFIYPWKAPQVKEMVVNLHTDIPELSFGLHWYAGNEWSQRLNNRLTEKTVWEDKTTVAHVLRRVLKEYA
jgi:hypothetical protein